MNSKSGVLGGIGDELKQVGKQFGQQVTGSTQKKTINNSFEQADAREKGGHQGYKDALNNRAASETQAMIDSLYAPSEPTPEKKSVGLVGQVGFDKKENTTATFSEQLGFGKTAETVGLVGQVGITAKKTPEEQKKIAQLKQQLHKDYVDQLNRPKPQTEAEVQEVREEQETAAERVERMKLEDEQKKQEKKKTETPLGVEMEQQKAEKFRGAAG